MSSSSASIKHCLSPYKGNYAYLVVLGIIVSLLDVGFALFLSWLVDFPFGDNIPGFFLLLGAGVGYILIQCLLIFLHGYGTRSFQERVLLYWRNELWKENLAICDDNPDEVGRGLAKIIDEMELISRKVLNPLLNFPTQVFAVFASLTVGFLINWAFGLLMISASPLLFLTVFLFLPIIKKRVNSYVGVFREYQDQTLDLLNSQKIAFGYHRDGFFRERAKKDSSALLSAEWAVGKADAPFEASHNALSFGIRLAAVAASSLLVGLGLGAESSLPACLFLSSTLVESLAMFATGLSDYLSGKSLMNNLNWNSAPRKPLPNDDFAGLALLSASPANGVPLKADLSVEPGEKVLLLGGPGSGKSTAIKMLSGLLEASDGEIKRPDRAGYCPQTPTVYPLSLDENIGLSDNLDVNKLGRAKAFAGIAFDREDCSTLSGGEQKRVGLARAYYHGEGCLLLDEPTTSIGKDGEKAIYQSILSYPGTVLASAHRVPLSIVGQFDQIYICADQVLRKVSPDDKTLRHYCLEGKQ